MDRQADWSAGSPTWRWRFSGPGVGGAGASASSNQFLLDEAAREYLRRPGLPLDIEEIGMRAWGREKALAGGHAIAANDVFPILYGGVVMVRTCLDDTVHVTPVAHGEAWLAHHVVLAVDPNGQRHDVPTLLADLFAHPEAGSLVMTLSKLARHAGWAIQERRIAVFAAAVREYVQVFSRWTKDRYVSPAVGAMARDLEAACPGQVLAWKPPGAGACHALIVITTDAGAVTRFFHGRGWAAGPIAVTRGLPRDTDAVAHRVSFSAGFRLDFVGTADLGIDPAIRQEGLCCACAIGPRSRLTVTQGVDASLAPAPRLKVGA